MSDHAANPVPAAPPPSRRRAWVPLAVLLLVAALIGIYRYRVTRPEYRFEAAKTAIANRQWDTAEWLAGRLDSSGREDLAILVRAESWIQRGDPLAALNLLNNYPPTGNQRSEAATMVGRCLMGLHRPRQAYSAFKLALELQPDQVEARRGSAQLAYNFGQLETAIEHLQHLIVLEPQDGKPRKLLGDILADLGRHEQAVEAYQGAIDKTLTAALLGEVRLSLARSLAKLGRFSDVMNVREEHLRTGREESPDWIALHVESLRAGSRSDDARKTAEAALLNHPQSSDLHSLLGQLQLEAGQPAAAVRSLARAHELAPRNYPICLQYSQALAADGQTAEAERVSKRAESFRMDLDLITKLTREAEQKPWDPAIRLQLAYVSERLGYDEMAKQWRAAAAVLSE